MESTLQIQNLKCGGCAHTITTRLENLEGINTVNVDNASHTVSFNYNEAQQLDAAITLLSTLGYPVEGASNPLTKKAKSFVSCAVGRLNS
nr:heavy-metal-associated domain-containing protein [uncultured Psychroserpens sp.]